MKEYVMIFRMDLTDEATQPTQQQMALYMHQWEHWMGQIRSCAQLTGGLHLSKNGRVLKRGKEIKEGPYSAENSSVAGYIVVCCDDMTQACEIASLCPILEGSDTSVEIRETALPGL